MSKNTPIEVATFLAHETVERKIYYLRGMKIMFDKDLAALYGVQTRNLNKAVTRNPDRFPPDFMFQLSESEFENLMFQFGTSSWGGTRKRPWAFTDYGILMLSSVLNSKRAIQVNIQIMRTFRKLREILFHHKDLQKKIEEMEKKYDSQFKVVFDAIREILEPKNPKPKKPIGFHTRY
ncbi:MAG: ORF6N domain-containing protein [Candidatus Omnitrophica bacterium]|nr:ORF6N domain-containing protein [Candidatus Omnitrophota bacterium]